MKLQTVRLNPKIQINLCVFEVPPGSNTGVFNN